MFQLGKRNTTRKNSPLPLPLPLRHPEVQSGGAVKELESLPDFFEPQESAGCGRHALNNLFGGKHFLREGGTNINKDTINAPIKAPLNLPSLCTYMSGLPMFNEEGKPLTCPTSEYYSSSLIIASLELLGYTAKPIKDDNSKAEWKKYPDTDKLIGYIINVPGHWVAFRKLADNNYRYIDSMIPDAPHGMTGSIPELVKHLDTKGLNILNGLEVRFTGKPLKIDRLTTPEKTTTNCPFELNDEITDATGNHYVVIHRELTDTQECKSITAVNIKTNEELRISKDFGTYKKVVDKTVNCKFSAGQGIVFNKIQYSIEKVNFKDNQCDSLDVTHQTHADDDTTKIVKSILFADYDKITVLKPGEEWRLTPGPSGPSGSSVATPANTSKFSLPLDDIRYNEVWNHCKQTLKQVDNIKGINSSSKVTLSLSADKSLSLLSSDKAVVENLSDVNAAKLLILLRYKLLVDNLSKKTTLSPLDFFNQLESNREYHARQCVTMCLTSTEIKIPGIDKFIPSALDPLDKFIYSLTVTEKHFSPYELTFLINHMMVSLATLESEWVPDLITDTYASAISSAESAKELPSHLRLLSRYLNQEASTKVSDVRRMYPQSLLLNYAAFYPFVLYHTGVKPI